MAFLTGSYPCFNLFRRAIITLRRSTDSVRLPLYKLYVHVALWCLAGVVLVQTLTTLYFIRRIMGSPGTAVSGPHCPHVAVILCVRGRDPFLETCIDALLKLDYARFELRIIVDSIHDPAWEVVQRAVEAKPADHLSVELLSSPSSTCSLKCSCLIQAIRSLDRSVEVIALADTDTIAHPTWLSELVAPLIDSDVAVSTGCRWYMPDVPNLGSLVRYTWNAAAAVQMVCFNIAWGGTLAIKRSTVDELALLSHWEQALCEDTLLHAQLMQHGKRQVFVPSLLMVNREQCTLMGFMRWVVRQLVTARLYHPSWPGTVAHGFAVTAAPCFATGMLALAISGGDSISAKSLVAGLALFELSLLALLIGAEWMVSRVLARRGEQTRWMKPSTVVMLPLVVAISQAAYPIALLIAVFVRRVGWRGVHYRIGARTEYGYRTVHLENYQVYREQRQDVGQSL